MNEKDIKNVQILVPNKGSVALDYFVTDAHGKTFYNSIRFTGRPPLESLQTIVAKDIQSLFERVDI